jgi:hypothetical protein
MKRVFTSTNELLGIEKAVACMCGVRGLARLTAATGDVDTACGKCRKK